eukprot:2469805-Rhodomonas_salina.1
MELFEYNVPGLNRTGTDRNSSGKRVVVICTAFHLPRLVVAPVCYECPIYYPGTGNQEKKGRVRVGYPGTLLLQRSSGLKATNKRRNSLQKDFFLGRYQDTITKYPGTFRLLFG